jgi:hypothetical protein
MRFRHMLAGVAISFATLTSFGAKAVEIEYWQYVFDARIKAMDELIKRFEAANPNIKVKHTTFPYADYQTKIAAAVPGRPGTGRGAAVLWLARQFRRRQVHPAAAPRRLSAGDDREGILSDRLGDEARWRVLRPADRSALAGAVLQQEAVPGGGLDPAKPPRRSTSSSTPPRRRPSATLPATCSRPASRSISRAGLSLVARDAAAPEWRRAL